MKNWIEYREENYIPKVPKYIKWLIFAFFILLGLSCLLTMWEKECTTHGFGANSQGDVFVAEGRKIVVFHDGIHVNTITDSGSDAFSITVLPNGTIQKVTDRQVIILDVQGNKLSFKEKPDASELYYDLAKKDSFIAEDGRCYLREKNFGRQKIVCDGKIVYQSPVIGVAAYLVRIVLVISAVVFLPFIVKYRLEIADWSYQLFYEKRRYDVADVEELSKNGEQFF